jgi:hypothetical protein
MAIADDFSVNGSGDIRYGGGGSTYYTVLELHRWLQDLADDEEKAGDDLVDILTDNPSARSSDTIITLNSPFNIDDDAAEQLYGGSITQDDGDTVYAGLEVAGSVESGTQLMIVRDNTLITSWWGTGINDDAENSIIMSTLIRIRGGTGKVGALIDGGRVRVMAREFGDTYAEFTITLGLGVKTAAVFTEADNFNTTAEGTVSGWSGISNTEGYQTIDLNNGNGAQPYYSQWDKDIYTIGQLYERTKWLQRRGSSSTIYGMNGQLFRGVNDQWDYDGKSGTISEGDLLGWGTYFAFDNGSGTFTLGEYVKIGTNEYKAKVVYYSGAGATGTLAVMMESTSETISDGDAITGLSSGATADINGSVTDNDKAGGMGYLLADDTSDTIWVQIIVGLSPADNVRFWSTDNDGYALVDGSHTARSIRPAFFGQYTGSSMIGSFGLGVEATDLATADILTDLLNATQSPPNNQTFTVSGVVSGEDRVLVAPNDGSDGIDFDQLALNTTLSGASETSVVVTTSIPSDTPASGTIRIETDGGIYKYVEYTSWTGSTFTISSTNFSGDNATAGNNVFISYIDTLADSTQESFTAVYSSPRSLVVRVRDGGATPIKSYDTPSTFTSSGGSVTAIRTSDA